MPEEFTPVPDAVLRTILELDATATPDWKVERGNAGSEHPLFLSTGGHGGWRLGSDENTAIAGAARNSIRAIVLEVLSSRAAGRGNVGALRPHCDGRACQRGNRID